MENLSACNSNGRRKISVLATATLSAFLGKQPCLRMAQPSLLGESSVFMYNVSIINLVDVSTLLISNTLMHFCWGKNQTNITTHHVFVALLLPNLPPSWSSPCRIHFFSTEPRVKLCTMTSLSASSVAMRSPSVQTDPKKVLSKIKSSLCSFGSLPESPCTLPCHNVLLRRSESVGFGRVVLCQLCH